jgi:protein phosphatase 1 regulatory subunit 16A
LRWNVLVNSTRKYVFCFQLHIAAANGYLSVVEFLLEHSVRKDVRDKDDWQPSHAAACWGHLEVLELLAQAGADLNAKNKHDETPAGEESTLESRHF